MLALPKYRVHGSLLQRPLALPLVLLEVVRNPLRWRRLRPLLGLDRPALRYRRRSSRSPHMAEHRGHLAERRSCGQKRFVELGFSVNLYRYVVVIPIAAMTGR